MLQASRGMKISPIPKTAPFAEDEIEVLNRVVGPASATQRAWLAGFLAGLDAAHAAPQPAAPPQAAEPLTILYATESGNAERLASDVAKSARKLGFKPMLVDMADLELVNLAKARRLVVIASTSPCWHSATPPMPSSAQSARRSTRGWQRSAESARSIASIAISISPSPPRAGSMRRSTRWRRRRRRAAR